MNNIRNGWTSLAESILHVLYTCFEPSTCVNLSRASQCSAWIINAGHTQTLVRIAGWSALSSVTSWGWEGWRPWMNIWTGDRKFRTGEEWQPRLNSRIDIGKFRNKEDRQVWLNIWILDVKVQGRRGVTALAEQLELRRESSGLEKNGRVDWTVESLIGKSWHRKV
jgi:hypothetical protein